MATRQAKANLFDSVPSEIILRILDYMWPDDYSGFTFSLTGAWLRSLRERRKEYEAELNTGCYTVDYDPDL